jgi:hypothetical protein
MVDMDSRNHYRSYRAMCLDCIGPAQTIQGSAGTSELLPLGCSVAEIQPQRSTLNHADNTMLSIDGQNYPIRHIPVFGIAAVMPLSA